MLRTWIVNSLTVFISGVAVATFFLPERWHNDSRVQSFADSPRSERGFLAPTGQGKGGPRSLMVKKDFSVLAREFHGLTGMKRKIALRSLAEEWAVHDAVTALRWANSLPRGAERHLAIIRIFSRPEDAIALARAVEEQKIRLELVQNEDYTDYTDYTDSFGTFAVVLGQQIGYEAALSWVNENVGGRLKDHLIEVLIEITAEKNLHAAVALLDGMKSDGDLEAALRTIMNSNNDHVREKAAVILKYAETNEVEFAIQLLTRQWIASDPDDLILYIREADRNSPGMNLFISSAAVSLVDRNPVAGRELIGAAVGSRYLAGIRDLYRKWLLIDEIFPPLENDDRNPVNDVLMATANKYDELDFVGDLIRADDHSGATSTLMDAFVTRWAAISQTDCGVWLSSLPPGLPLDAGAEAFAKYLSNHDHSTAIRWAEKIGDSARREEVMSVIARKK